MPTVISSEIVTHTTESTLTLVAFFRNLNGKRCTSETLKIKSFIFLNEMEIIINIQSYSPGRHEIIFENLLADSAYSYQINVTKGDSVIASYLGSISTRKCTML